MRSSVPPSRRWRPSVLMLVTLWFAAIASAACCAMIAFTPGSAGWRLPCAAFFLALGAIAALKSRSRIDLHPDRVVLKGLRRSARTVPLEQIVAVTPERYGLWLKTGRYASVIGPAYIGEKSRGLQMLRIRNHGDRIAETIVSHAEAYRALHPDRRTELQQVVDDLAETLAWAGHGDDAAWLEANKEALASTDRATRAAARQELHDASTGKTGRLREVYLGVNGAFFNDRLSRLSALTEKPSTRQPGT